MQATYWYAGARLFKKTGAATQVYLSDRLSTRLTLSDIGAVAGRQGHLPFGDDFAESGTQEKHHFTSYERDGESGFDYGINRYYAISAGRFGGVDQADHLIETPQSANRYSYVENDPITFYDPEGLHHVRIDPRYTAYLGGADPDVGFKFTAKYGIRYNDRGFDFNLNTLPKRFKKGVKKLRNAGAPEVFVDLFRTWDGSQIPNWIDDAFDGALANFVRCGGSLADRASRVNPTGVTVYIEQSIFDVYVNERRSSIGRGIYIQDVAEIHVVNFYYSVSEGSVSLASDVLKYEYENYIGWQVGIQPEPRTPNWPCDAPPR